MQRIIKKFCWKPHIIIDDYGNDHIKWLGTVYIMQCETIFNDEEIWKDVRFATKEEYLDYLFDELYLPDLDLLLMIVSVFKRRKLRKHEINSFYKFSDYFRLQVTYSEDTLEPIVYAEIGLMGIVFYSNNLSFLTKSEKEAVKYKANKRKFFWNNNLLI